MAFGEIRARIEQFISGTAPTDPLYLSNRPWQQKLRLAVVIAAPVALVIVLWMVGVRYAFHANTPDGYEHAASQPAAAPVTDFSLPKMSEQELEVLNIRIARDKSPAVIGVVRNNTGHPIGAAQVNYFLSNAQGEIVGTDTAEVKDVPAHASAAFRAPLKAADARYVLVHRVEAK